MSGFAEHFDLRYVEVDGCWMWTGRIAPTGYGTYGAQYAHRLSYEMHVGPIPAGLTIDHLCHVRSCVNPSHMEPVTREENGRRNLAQRQDRCKRGHDLTDLTNLYPHRDGRGRCRQCALLRSRGTAA